MKKEIKVCLFPIYGNENPYQELMANGLREGGLIVECGSKNRLFGILKTYFIQRPDWIHFDWIYSLYSVNLPLPIKWLYLYWFLFQLSFLRIFTKCKFGFTLHNFNRHEYYNSKIDHIAHQKVFSLCSFVRIFNEEIKCKIVTKWKNVNIKKFHVLPEGSYVGYYPNNVTMVDARSKLGLSTNDFVILCLGSIRPYKGVLELISAFLDFKEINWKLIIAGYPYDKTYTGRVQNKISGNNNIKLFVGHQAEEKLQYYFNACNIVACPFREIENSGSVILAMGFKKAVIAPRMGVLVERLKNQTELLYEESLEQSFEVLKQLSKEKLEQIGENNFQTLSKYKWSDFAKAF